MIKNCQKGLKWSEMVSNDPIMIQNDPNWPEMSGNNPKWSIMV